MNYVLPETTELSVTLFGIEMFHGYVVNHNSDGAKLSACALESRPPDAFVSEFGTHCRIYPARPIGLFRLSRGDART